ncbi:MAG: hypothetical protein PHG67_04345 [Bacteroidales bacterium]|mgnify:CR=1 FL=1|jgi:hypothetical protein|nr:hypothetical protein [Bacteroidales bacterium]
MNWKPFGKSGKIPIDIAYQYHKPDSNCLVVYNLTSRTLRQLEVVIICKSGINYSIKLNELLKKTGDLISLSDFNEGTLNHTLIDHIIIKAPEINCTFMPEQNKFRLK